MVEYTCERCGKTFDHRGDYGKHLDRKVPCNGGENAPTLIELRERLQKLENELHPTPVATEPEPEPVYDHPVSRTVFEACVAEVGEFNHEGTPYKEYLDYMGDCLEADDVCEEYSEEVLNSWNRKAWFEDLFKKYHVYDVIGPNKKKNIPVKEYRMMFAKFIDMVYTDDDDEEPSAEELPAEIAKSDTDGTISKFTTMITRMENSLYRIGVVGTSARDSLIPLIIMRLLQNHFESGVVDVMDIETHGYDDDYITEETIRYVLLKNYADLDAASASDMLRTIWEYVLSKHSITCKIFEPGKYIDIRSDGILLSIIRELVAFDFENCSPDNLSLAYQHFIHRQFKGESGSRMGQFFTPDKLIAMMIREYGHLIPDTGNYIDPFMGTAGFVSAMYNARKDARTSENPSEYLYGTEIDPNVFKYAFTNLLVQTGEVCDNIKNDSAFPNHKHKYDAIFTNPPFGKNIATEEKSQTLKYNHVKVLSKNLVCLQYCMHLLAPGGVCSMVWMYGADCYGSKKAAIEVRKRLFTEFHFIGAIVFPKKGKVFEHTGVNTVVLTFRKPIDEDDVVTPQMKIYESDPECEKITLVADVNADQLAEKEYAISIDAYKERETFQVPEGFEIKTLGEVCDFTTGKKKSKKEMGNGPYLVMGGGEKPAGVTNEYNTDEKTILISRVGSAGFVSICDDKCWSTDNIFRLEPKNINKNYLYYVLKYGITKKIKELASGAAQPVVNMTNLKSLQIPVPSLKRQKEMVQHWINLSKLVSSAQKEVTRLKLFIGKTINEYMPFYSEGDEIKTLGDVCELKNGKFQSNDMSNEGDVPFYNCSANNPAGTHKDHSFDYEKYILLITAGGSEHNRNGENVGLGKVYLVEGKTACRSGVYSIVANDSGVYIKYVYYYLKNNKNDITELAVFTTNLGVIKQVALKHLQIPIPSLDRQQIIVEEYEKYEAILAKKCEELQMYQTLMSDTIKAMVSV